MASSSSGWYRAYGCREELAVFRESMPAHCGWGSPWSLVGGGHIVGMHPIKCKVLLLMSGWMLGLLQGLIPLGLVAASPYCICRWLCASKLGLWFME